MRKTSLALLGVTLLVLMVAMAFLIGAFKGYSQEKDQVESTQWADAGKYSAAANAFNERLSGSFSGFLARLMGITEVKGTSDGFFREREHEIDRAYRYYEEDTRVAKKADNNLSLWQIALIGFVLYKIFGRDSRTGKKRGCGPLGWIFGTWGFSKFFGWRK